MGIIARIFFSNSTTLRGPFMRYTKITFIKVKYAYAAKGRKSDMTTFQWLADILDCIVELKASRRHIIDAH